MTTALTTSIFSSTQNLTPEGSTYDRLVDSIGISENKPNGLPLVLLQLVLDYLINIETFGEEEWNTLIGRVEAAPLLPLNLIETLRTKCPIFPSKEIHTTHRLILIPDRVNGQPLTLSLLKTITEKRFPQHRIDHTIINITQKNVPVTTSYWILMTPILPDSRSKKYALQQEMINQLAITSLAFYTLPTALEAAVSFFANYSDDPTSKRDLLKHEASDYTRCQEAFLGCHIVAKPWDSDGFYITPYCNHSVCPHVGVATVRKL